MLLRNSLTTKQKENSKSLAFGSKGVICIGGVFLHKHQTNSTAAFNWLGLL